ncbi:ferritin-like domain-containing protein [Asanoa sp. WMMD1127]|uniref:ferritin-like domain-containing protein n=1 Tax=Asanoa sp. WMMD1127 TaxID=3016107 RepID=UPI002415B91B|nr:ferritin-like domain-containing protein [Asanoa sp. WMMD1127]MDG4823641.1 ferritin-like domain-containing protein [Asanoa sp. WMMD1127]
MTGELTAALSAEYAAIFAYGPIGVRLTGAEQSAARAAEAAHRTLRDALVVALHGTGLPPAAAAYTLPEPIVDRAAALRVAIAVEEKTAAVWRAALGATVDTQRRQALDALTGCAVRATRWRRFAKVDPITVPFPGKAPA